MQIQIASEQMDENTVSTLRQILARNEHGQCGVGFEYRTPHGVCKLDVAHDWRIVPNKLMLEQLESIVGQPNIRLIY